MAVRGYRPEDNQRAIPECENCEDIGWEKREVAQFSIAWTPCMICRNRRSRPAPRDGIPVFFPPPGVPGSQ